MVKAYNTFDSADLKVRKYVMASYLYYRSGESIMHDADFDRLCRDLIDEFEDIPAHYLEKHNITKDALECGTGYQITYTLRSIWGAISWFKELTGRQLPFNLDFEKNQINSFAASLGKTDFNFLDDEDEKPSSFLD